jgi:hypothetical protein
MRRNYSYWIAAIGLLCAAPAFALGDMDPHFSYQGQLLEAGEPVTDLVSMRFSLWNAASSGLQLGSDFSAMNVDVVDGLFTVQIDSSYFDPNGFNGDPRWLEIEVYDTGSGWVTLSPRQPVNATPYALYAADSPGGGGSCLWSQNGSNIYYNSGNVGIGTASPTMPLSTVGNATTVISVSNTSAGATGSGVTADTSATGAAGVVGRNNSSTGNTQGVFGLAYSPDGQGVRGQNGASSGDAFGVYGLSSSTDGIAVYGRASNSSGAGTTIGVMGEISNNTGSAVYGEATATTGTASGVWATTASTEGSGVFGQNTNTSGDNEGVMGVCWSPTGKGVFGYNGSTGTTAIGVLGRTNSGYGVRGEATHTSNTNYGVYGSSSSANGYGVYGTASGTGTGVRGQSADGYGVYGYSTSHWSVAGVSPQNSGQAGVVGAIINHTGGMLWKPNSGVSGSCEDGQGVAGRTYSGVGVWGEQVNSGNVGQLGTADAGVHGQTGNAGDYGVWGQSSNADGFAGYFTGGKSYFEGGVGIGVSPASDPKLRVSTSSFTAVYGQSSSTSGRGVWGYASATTGPAYGVYGVSGSSSGAGVCGESGTNGCPAVMGISGYGNGAGGWFQSENGDAIYAHTEGVNKAALYASIADQSYGIVIDQADGYNLEPAIQVNATGHTTGLDVNLQDGVARLAEFTLDNGDFTQTAFLVEADTAGPVAEFIGSNTSNSDHMLIARNAGTGSTIYAEHTRASNDVPAIYGKHAVTDYYGVGVKGEGGYRGVEGRVTATGSSTYTGVYGYVSGGSGTNYGVYGYASGSGTNYAGYFSGNLRCTGQLTKGSGTFMIDHPLDPENKYLYHSFVESPDMMNIYNGNVVLDQSGQAVVTMPEWFEALNMEFRYQLTCIGGFAQVYIAEEIADNQFKIAGGRPGLKVSWQVTGIRQDPFANAHRVQVEVDKPEDEIGTYLHPEEWGVSPELQVDRVREAREQDMKQAVEID